MNENTALASIGLLLVVFVLALYLTLSLGSFWGSIGVIYGTAFALTIINHKIRW